MKNLYLIKNKIKYRYAFTLIEIMIVVAIIGILIAVGSAYHQRAKSQTFHKACCQNMAVLDSAITRYSLDKNTENIPESLDDVFMQELVKEGYLKNVVKCPLSGSYKLETKNVNDVKEKIVKCSIHGTRFDKQ